MASNKIVLYGHFGSGNIGNDSTFEAALHHVRKYQSQSRVICVCTGPSEISKRFGTETLPISVHPELQATRSRFRILRILPRLSDELRFWLKYRSWAKPGDCFIVVGTGAVDDLGVRRPWASPYELYKWCKIAKNGGAQVIFLSVGAGPIRNRISRALMLRALQLADYRSYREKAAFDYLRSVGFNTTGDFLYPDLVFSLRKDLPPLRQSSDGQPKVVGLGLMAYRGWHRSHNSEAVYQRYITQIEAFVAWLLKRGIAVRIFPGDTTDLEIVQEIKTHFHTQGDWPGSGLLVAEPVVTVDDLLAQIAQTDIVVASRFHNVLSALMVGVPVISLGYHDKNTNLMSAVGLEKYCQHIERFTFEKLVEQFESYAAEREQAIQRMHEKKEEYWRLLDEQYRNILRPEEHREADGAVVRKEISSGAAAAQ
jgi:polysaccharide pyruvyl transferase WcaK-like protein